MAWLRGAVRLLPVVGPAVDATDAASQGDRVGAAIELCNVAWDLCSILGPGAGLRAGLLASKMGNHASRHAGKVAKRRFFSRATWRSSRRVLKWGLKKKLQRKVGGVALKVGVAAIALADEKVYMRCGASDHRQRPRLIAGTKRQVPAVPAAAAAAESSIDTFTHLSSSESQLHAVLADSVYLPCDKRKGVVATVDPHQIQSGDDVCHAVWYAYVGGSKYRGFWYSAALCHLVLAERGTVGDADDLQRDALLALSLGRAAMSGRARDSAAELAEQARSHQCRRITATGHSLGGTVAAYVTCTSQQSTSPICSGHVFNPGGLPDCARSLSCLLASAEIVVHRIRGDKISVGFLPALQRLYNRRPGYGETDSHRMVHFLK